MIPPLDEDGNLPPGVYQVALEEVVARFGRGSQERAVEAAELTDFVRWARQNGVKRLLVGGSFVSAKAAPNDVDIVILPGKGFEEQLFLLMSRPEQWPFIHINVARDETDLGQWAREDFGTDRAGRARGIVEVVL
jgi:hypothetical protein